MERLKIIKSVSEGWVKLDEPIKSFVLGVMQGVLLERSRGLNPGSKEEKPS